MPRRGLVTCEREARQLDDAPQVWRGRRGRVARGGVVGCEVGGEAAGTHAGHTCSVCALTSTAVSCPTCSDCPTSRTLRATDARVSNCTSLTCSSSLHAAALRSDSPPPAHAHAPSAHQSVLVKFNAPHTKPAPPPTSSSANATGQCSRGLRVCVEVTRPEVREARGVRGERDRQHGLHSPQRALPHVRQPACRTASATPRMLPGPAVSLAALACAVLASIPAAANTF